jgi:hypothetical protein
MIILNSQLNSHIVNECGSENVVESETTSEDEVRGHDFSTISAMVNEIEHRKTYMSFILLLKTAVARAYQNDLRIAISLIYLSSVVWTSSSTYSILIVAAVQLVFEFRSYVSHMKHIRDHKEKKGEYNEKHEDIFSHQCDCRIKIQSILGEIRAPLLTPISPFDMRCEHVGCDILLHFAKTESELFHSLDTAIYNLRIITALNLGLGPYSPSLERIQDSKILSDGARMNANAYVSKQLLFQCMHRHFLSLVKLCRNIMSQNNICYDYVEKYQKHYEHVAESPVLTISILKKCRRCNAEILSSVLSFILKCNLSCDVTIVNEVLHTSLLQSKELRAYIVSYFHLEEVCDSDGKNVFVDKLVYIQKHLHATQVAIWTYSKSLQSPASNQKERENRDGEEKKLFHHISTLLQEAFSAYIHLSNTLYPGNASINANESEDEVIYDDIATPQDNITYDDMGLDDINPQCQGITNQSHRFKTVVFSGKGTKSKKALSANADHFQTISNLSSDYANERIQLLMELQTRLTLMDFGEEINADSSDDSDIQQDQRVKDNKPEGACLKINPTKNTNFVANDFLLELKGKLRTDSDTNIVENSDNQVI